MITAQDIVDAADRLTDERDLVGTIGAINGQVYPSDDGLWVTCALTDYEAEQLELELWGHRLEVEAREWIA